MGPAPQLSAFQTFSNTVTLGQPLKLSVGTLGGALAGYQWQRDQVDVPGATGPILTISAIDWTNAGVYRIVMSNALQRLVGPSITVTVLAGPLPLQFDPSPDQLRVAADGLHLRLLGATGAGPVVIQASGDLLTWQPLYTNPAVIGPLEYTDSAITNNSARFYRAFEQR
jgi:hypothetical protein